MVNSSHAKIPAFNETCDANLDYRALVAFATQTSEVTGEQAIESYDQSTANRQSTLIELKYLLLFSGPDPDFAYLSIVS